MKESDFYQRHVRKLRKFLDLERIESSIGSGFPDICAAGYGKQFLIETKVSKKLEGPECLFFERFQISFYSRRIRYTDDRGVFILALVGKNQVCLWRAREIINSERFAYKKWNVVKVDEAKPPLIEFTGFAQQNWDILASTMVNLS